MKNKYVQILSTAIVAISAYALAKALMENKYELSIQQGDIRVALKPAK